MVAPRPKGRRSRDRQGSATEKHSFSAHRSAKPRRNTSRGNKMMTNKRIHIDNLRIKLPASMRGSAHEIAGSIGRDIARNVGDLARTGTGSVAIDEIAVGHVRDVSTIGKRTGEKIGEVLNSR